MNSGRPDRADYPLLCHKHLNPIVHPPVKARMLATSLCILMLFLVSCGQLSEGQRDSSGNKQLTQQIAHNQFTYVAIGASDTFGIGTSDPYMDNWPTDLSEKLGQKVHLINLGIPGITLNEALGLELPVALDSHPQLITIWLGVNDIADKVAIPNYSRDLDFLLSRLKSQAPSAQVLIANIPDLTLLPYFASYNQQELQRTIAEFNQTIAREALQHHVLLVDMSQQNYNLRDHPEFISGDGLHPTDLGYVKIAELFYQTLEQSQR